MKKAFLKSLAAFVVATTFVLIGGGFTMGNTEISEVFTEIVVEGVECCQKEQLIISTLSDEEIMSTMSILCIFGHSMSTGTVIEINHRFWASAPRCRERIHRVNFCTRNNCNHMVTTLVGESRISCCS
jgi:hypothetical protein